MGSLSAPTNSLGFGQVSSVEIERICNGVDKNVVETAAIGVPSPGGGPEQLVIAVVLKDSDNTKADLNQLKISFNSAVQRKLNPLFRVLMFDAHTVAVCVKTFCTDNMLTCILNCVGFSGLASLISSKNSNK
jgi:hypothetical protein